MLQKIIDILLSTENYPYDFRKVSISIHKLSNDNSFEIDYNCMYKAPELNFQTLQKLSELFGTTSINVDNYGYEGCDTCNWGSKYGHTIQVYNSTKNSSDITSLYGKKFVYKGRKIV